MEDLFKDIKFITELEKMKYIERRTRTLGSKRRENDAEHSWHISVMALLLEKYSREEIDVNRVIKMLLIHDIVEIYAGDTFAYDDDISDQELREKAAMFMIKKQLSSSNANQIEELWMEFERGESKEAKYAVSMDRLQPILNNIEQPDGGTWSEYKVKKSQVIKRIAPIKNFNEEIYDFLIDKINQSVEKGHLIGDIN